MKYLGVIIDAKLNRISHLTYIKNKIAKEIGIIRKARPLLNKRALTNLYHTLIYPYLMYCVEVWGSAKYVSFIPYFALTEKINNFFGASGSHRNPIFTIKHSTN